MSTSRRSKKKRSKCPLGSVSPDEGGTQDGSVLSEEGQEEAIATTVDLQLVNLDKKSYWTRMVALTSLKQYPQT